MSETIVAYKGFDKDLKCHGGFQYEDGETYKPDTWYTLKDGRIVEVSE